MTPSRSKKTVSTLGIQYIPYISGSQRLNLTGDQLSSLHNQIYAVARFNVPALLSTETSQLSFAPLPLQMGYHHHRI